MRSAFNLLVFPNSMFTPFLYEGAVCSGEIALKNNHYYYLCSEKIKVYVESLKGVSTNFATSFLDLENLKPTLLFW